MKPTQTLIRFLIYAVTWIFSKLVLCIPYRVAVAVGGVLGGCVPKLLPSAKNMVSRNLHAAFPEKTSEEIRSLTHKIFVHLGKNLFELLESPRLDKQAFDTMIEVYGFEHIDAALKQKRGVLLLAAHVGNWELMAMYLALHGYPLHVVARRIYDDRLNAMLLLYRNAKGVKTLLRTESTKEMVRAIRNNEILGLLIDQDTAVKGCFVDFFGRPAYTPSGLALLALKYNAVVLPIFTQRLSSTRHHVTVQPPVELSVTGDIERDIQENTQRYTKIIEQIIRECPEQWVWVHDRWKTKIN